MSVCLLSSYPLHDRSSAAGATPCHLAPRHEPGRVQAHQLWQLSQTGLSSSDHLIYAVYSSLSVLSVCCGEVTPGRWDVEVDLSSPRCLGDGLTVLTLNPKG
jgi:hypothetical protein